MLEKLLVKGVPCHGHFQAQTVNELHHHAAVNSVKIRKTIQVVMNRRQVHDGFFVFGSGI